MLIKLLIIFVTIPLIELALLFQVAEMIGGWETFSLVIITGIIGSIMTKKEGARTFLQIQRELQANRIPTLDIIGAFLVFGAGLLLLTPGIITDIVGFTMLVPPLRRKTAAFIMTKLKKHLRFFTATDRRDAWHDFTEEDQSFEEQKYRGDDVIEVEAEEIVEEEEDDDEKE